MSSRLPRFGASKATASGTKVARRLVFEADGKVAPTVLRELALESLDELCSLEAAALEPALRPYSKTLFGERSLDVERSTLGRELRETLEARVRSLILALSPVVDRRPAQIVLEFLTSRYDALDFASTELLTACLPSHATSFMLATAARATRGATSGQWDFLTTSLTRDDRYVSRGFLARQCTADGFFVDRVCAVGALAARAIAEHANRDSEARLVALYEPHFLFVAGTLCEAIEVCRGKPLLLEHLARHFLPHLSDFMRERLAAAEGSRVGFKSLRVAAYAVVAAFAAGAGSAEAIEATVSEVVHGALMDDVSDLRRALCVAVVSQSRVGNGCLNSETLNELLRAPNAAAAARELGDLAAKGDNAAAKVLHLFSPQLAAHAVATSHTLALQLAIELGCERDAETARVVLLHAASREPRDLEALTLLANAAARCAGHQIDGALALPAFKPVLNAKEASPELALARLRLTDKLLECQMPPTGDPKVTAVLEARLSTTDSAEKVLLLETLAVDSKRWARRNVETALSETGQRRLARAAALFMRHVDSVDDLVLVDRLADHRESIHEASAIVQDEYATSSYTSLARSLLLRESISVPDDVAIAIATRLQSQTTLPQSDALELRLLMAYFSKGAQAQTAEVGVTAAPRLAQLGGDTASAVLQVLAAIKDSARVKRALEAAALAALGRLAVDPTFEVHVMPWLESLPAPWSNSIESSVAWAMAHRVGESQDLRLARIGALVLAKSRAAARDSDTALVPWILAAAGDKHEGCRSAAVDWLEACGDVHAKFAAARKAAIVADADQLAVAVRAHLDSSWLDLFFEPLAKAKTEPLDLALSLALIENLFEKGGKQSALVAAWTAVETTSLSGTLGETLNALLAERAPRRGNAIRTALAKAKTKELVDSPGAQGARAALLDALLRSRIDAASSDGGLELDEEVANILCAALSAKPPEKDASSAREDDDFNFLATWNMRSTPWPRTRALEALANRKPNNRVTERLEAELFAACLTLLRADHDGDNFGAPPRSLALAALRGLGVADGPLARAWDAALRRPETTVHALPFLADVSALLDATAARRVPSALPSRAMFAALRRIVALKPQLVEAEATCRQLIAEVEALATSWKKNRTTEPLPGVDLDLIIEAADDSEEMARAMAAVVRVAPASAVSQRWQEIAGVATSCQGSRACQVVFAALVPALLAPTHAKDKHKPRLAVFVRELCASHVSDLRREESQQSSVLQALSRALGSVLSGAANGAAVVALFVLARCAELKDDGTARHTANAAKAAADALIATQKVDTQFSILAILAKAARRLAASCFVPAEGDATKKKANVVLSAKELMASGDGKTAAHSSSDFSIHSRDLVENGQERLGSRVATVCSTLACRRLAALQRTAPDRSRWYETEQQRLALCHELALSMALGDDETQATVQIEDVDDDDEDDENGIGTSSNGAIKVRLIRTFWRALRRAARLLGAPSFIAFMQHLLGTEHKLVRDAALEALHERLDASNLFASSNVDREDGRKRRRDRKDTDTAQVGTPTVLARLLLDELTPYVAEALVASGDERGAALSLSAARAADVLARALAERAPENFRPLVESAATTAAVAARASLPSSGARARAVFSLLSTLFATLRIRSLPVLAKALPRALDAVRSATARDSDSSLKLAGLHALHVIVASVPPYLHPYLVSILDLLVVLRATDVPVVDDHLVLVDYSSSSRIHSAVTSDEAATACRIARALASGLEPRLLLPALYAAYDRAKNDDDESVRKRASALDLALPAVEALGRSAVRAHAADVAKFGLETLVTPEQPSILEPPSVRITLALLLKLTERDLVDWLRTAADWGLDANETPKRSGLYLLLATILDRLKTIAAPHVAPLLLDAALSDLAQNDATVTQAEPKKRKRKQRKLAEHHRAPVLLRWRIVVALRLAFMYGEQNALDADKFDAITTLLIDLIVDDSPDHAAFVDNHLAPCIAALATATSDEGKHRAINHRLMLFVRDGHLHTRLAALSVVKAVVQGLGHEVANFANHMVQAISECLEDPNTTEIARDIVLLVDAATGIRIV